MKIGNWFFGCDICQEVCPWNRFETPTTEAAFQPIGFHPNPPLSALLDMDEEEFSEEFKGTAVRRAKHKGIQRNARIAHANAELRSHERSNIPV